MPRKTDTTKKCLQLEGWSHRWTWTLLRNQSVFPSQRCVGSPPRGRQRELMEENVFIVCFPCTELMQRGKLGCKHSLGGSGFFFLYRYETWKSNTIAIKIRGYIALGVLSVFPHIFICQCLRSEFRILLPSPCPPFSLLTPGAPSLKSAWILGVPELGSS